MVFHRAMSNALIPTLRAILTDLATERRTIPYLELALAAGMTPPHTIHRLTEALEQMIREDHAANRPLLAALATRKAGDMPGRGFFLLLAELGRYDGSPDGADAARHHAALLHEAFDHWGKP
ncbi:hypothetical protein AUP43_15145 [Oceanibaculum pacificum]|uniref:Uncharacterized protein n=2 Tax=Oceanibaculum pacificum TaxID=580166 RepID=A0A154V8F0_9PROT|nr:hypothetical protein AUP43_15145 [Oceanibaculum pacificum]